MGSLFRVGRLIGATLACHRIVISVADYAGFAINEEEA
jgi:hypothetical protein